MDQTPRPEGQQEPGGDGRGPVDAAALGQLPPAPPPYWPPPWPPPRRRIWPWLLGVAAVILMVVIGGIMLLGAVAALPAAMKTSSGPRETVYRKGDVTSRIVILPLEGAVMDDMEEFVRQALAKLEDNPPAALILRVDSPGGGIGASDRVWKMLKTFGETHRLPIVTSMGSLAASGGYYISMASQHIVAEPTCVTGSIGVIMPAASIEQMLQKLGVTPHVTVSTDAPLKDTGSFLRAWTEQDRAIVQGLVDAMQQRFVQVVAEGRQMPVEKVRQVAHGEPLTVQQALEARLIDEIGYLSDAIVRARELANLPPDANPTVTIFRQPAGLLDWLGADSQRSATWLREMAMQAACPRLEYRAPLN